MSYRKYLYAAAAPGDRIVKIGKSMSPQARIAELRKPGCALTPASVDVARLELLRVWPGDGRAVLWLRRQFRDRQVFGGWFDLGPDPAALLDVTFGRLPASLRSVRRDDPGPPVKRSQATQIYGWRRP